MTRVWTSERFLSELNALTCFDGSIVRSASDIGIASKRSFRWGIHVDYVVEGPCANPIGDLLRVPTGQGDPFLVEMKEKFGDARLTILIFSACCGEYAGRDNVSFFGPNKVLTFGETLKTKFPNLSWIFPTMPDLCTHFLKRGSYHNIDGVAALMQASCLVPV